MAAGKFVAYYRVSTQKQGHSGHVTLARGERSRLADYASEIL